MLRVLNARSIRFTIIYRFFPCTERKYIERICRRLAATPARTGVRLKFAFDCHINGNSHNHEFDGYVCVKMGNLINPDYVTRAFEKIINRKSLKGIRFYDLRHSCASLLLALDYSMKDIQEWLKHSYYQITANLYSHIDSRNNKI